MVCLFHFNTLIPFLKPKSSKHFHCWQVLYHIYNNKKKILSKHVSHPSLLEGASSLCPKNRGTDVITGPNTGPVGHNAEREVTWLYIYIYTFN